MRGGLRDRLILYAVHESLRARLDELGWFDSGRGHAPVKFLQGFPDDKDSVEPNSIAVTLEDINGELQELGSRLEESRMGIVVDLFCDSESVALHLSGDVYDFFKSRNNIPVFDVSDGEESDADPAFYIEIDSDYLSNRRSMRPTNPWQRHWRVVELFFNDMRANDDE